MCFSLTFGDERGLGLILSVGACAVGLCRNSLMWMRGTWGVFWRSAHVPAIPFTWLRRVQALGSTAHASPLHAGIKLLRVHVLFPMGSREFLCPNMGIVTSMWSHGRYDWFWLVKTKCAALWLATTTLSLMYYLHELCSASNLRAIEKRWKTSVQVDSQSHISHYHELMMLCLACQLLFLTGYYFTIYAK